MMMMMMMMMMMTMTTTTTTTTPPPPPPLLLVVVVTDPSQPTHLDRTMNCHAATWRLRQAHVGARGFTGSDVEEKELHELHRLHGTPVSPVVLPGGRRASRPEGLRLRLFAKHPSPSVQSFQASENRTCLNLDMFKLGHGLACDMFH